MIKERVFELKSKLQNSLGDYAKSLEFELFFSALVDYNKFNSTESVLEWLKDLNHQQYFNVEEILFSQLTQWHFDPVTGDLKHNNNKFFSIRGFQVFNSWSGDLLWDQPIIDQPEVGILGILCKMIDGMLYFLMQAKAEPGNINTYQISPTVQATRSNYTQSHGGKSTRYLEYFIGQRPVRIVYYQYQSEQGARFLEKRNRNIIVFDESNSTPELSPNHKWLTLGQIKSLMEHDNTVNMDSRSVISLIRYWNSEYRIDAQGLASILEDYADVITRSEFWQKCVLQSFAHQDFDNQFAQIRNALNWKRYFCFLNRNPKPLKDLREWDIDAGVIQNKTGKFFKVLAVKINANNREVSSWDQPILCQRNHGLIGLISSHQDGICKFLVQMKIEPGLYDLVELAPTLQCIVQNYEPDNLPKYLSEFAGKSLVYQAKQSEEGGRFYRECNVNMIREIDGFHNEDAENFIWITLAGLKEMVQTQQMLNIELRSLMAYF